jgi:hypothetical protein
MTQLHYDAYCGNLSGLVWCLEQGMDPNAVAEYRGYTPLHWLADMAAAGGDSRVEMLRALVEHGADINAHSAEGETALTLAREASGQGDELAEVLVAMGAIDEQV